MPDPGIGYSALILMRPATMPIAPLSKDIAIVHAYAALKPDGRIDADTVRSTMEGCCQIVSMEAVVEVEVSLAKKGV